MRTADGYRTRQRGIIANTLKETSGHITVDALVLKLAERGESVGRTTVWRCLERMAEEGSVQKYVHTGESACYQYVGGTAHCSEHFHLKRERCGRLIHMECDTMEKLAKHIETGHNFKINPFKTVLYGVCGECDGK